VRPSGGGGASGPWRSPAPSRCGRSSSSRRRYCFCLAFGIARGTVYATVGATGGAVIGFMIARTLGADFVRAQLGDRLADGLTNRWGAGAVFVLNLIPVVPMTAINYGAGLSGMHLLPFTLAVVGGVAPRAFAYSFFGHSLLDVGSSQFVLALTLLLALIVVPLWVRRHLSNRRRAAGGVCSAGSFPVGSFRADQSERLLDPAKAGRGS
jgi:hypothetical protein